MCREWRWNQGYGLGSGAAWVSDHGFIEGSTATRAAPLVKDRRMQQVIRSFSAHLGAQDERAVKIPNGETVDSAPRR